MDDNHDSGIEYWQTLGQFEELEEKKNEYERLHSNQQSAGGLGEYWDKQGQEECTAGLSVQGH